MGAERSQRHGMAACGVDRTAVGPTSLKALGCPLPHSISAVRGAPQTVAGEPRPLHPADVHEERHRRSVDLWLLVGGHCSSKYEKETNAGCTAPCSARKIQYAHAGHGGRRRPNCRPPFPLTHSLIVCKRCSRAPACAAQVVVLLSPTGPPAAADPVGAMRSLLCLALAAGEAPQPAARGSRGPRAARSSPHTGWPPCCCSPQACSPAARRAAARTCGALTLS